MKVVGAVLALLVLVAFSIFALWPYERSSVRRRDRSNDTNNADTNGIIPGSGGDKPDYEHHADHGGGDAGEDVGGAWGFGWALIGNQTAVRVGSRPRDQAECLARGPQ
jgi:hypothetical protein